MYVDIHVVFQLVMSADLQRGYLLLFSSLFQRHLLNCCALLQMYCHVCLEDHPAVNVLPYRLPGHNLDAIHLPRV